MHYDICFSNPPSYQDTLRRALRKSPPTIPPLIVQGCREPADCCNAIVRPIDRALLSTVANYCEVVVCEEDKPSNYSNCVAS